MFGHKFLLLYLTLDFYADADKNTDDSCFYSKPTISAVDDCPKNITEWMKAKDRKQCRWIFQNCTKQDRFVYHCLPDRYLEHFIEVCAPTKWIVGCNCPFYNTEKLVIEPNYNHPCKNHSVPCEAYYCSSSVYEYQDCYKEMRQKKTTYANKYNTKTIELLLGVLVLCSILQIVCAHGEKLQLKVTAIYRYISGKMYSLIGNEDNALEASERNDADE